MSRASRIQDYLVAQQGAMLQLLEELVLMETPSSEPASQQPILARLGAEFEALGYGVRQLPGTSSGGHLYAEGGALQ